VQQETDIIDNTQPDVADNVQPDVTDNVQPDEADNVQPDAADNMQSDVINDKNNDKEHLTDDIKQQLYNENDKFINYYAELEIMIKKNDEDIDSNRKKYKKIQLQLDLEQKKLEEDHCSKFDEEYNKYRKIIVNKLDRYIDEMINTKGNLPDIKAYNIIYYIKYCNIRINKNILYAFSAKMEKALEQNKDSDQLNFFVAFFENPHEEKNCHKYIGFFDNYCEKVKKLAEKGYSYAQVLYGVICKKRHYKNAACDNYIEAANKGNYWGMELLANSYYCGYGGINCDNKKALLLYDYIEKKMG